MKNFNKILLITLLFALKFNTFSQVCNQSTLNPSTDPSFTVITVNTTKNPGYNIYLCPGITVYDTLGTGNFGPLIIYVSPNSKFIYKSTFWGNTKIFAKSTSTVVIKNFTFASFCVPSWTIVSEPGATIINQTTVAITGTNNISCASLQGPNVVCPSCIVSINTIPSSTVCSGNSATLSASGATTYTWLPGNIQSQTLSIMPVSNTVYTVNGSCGSFSSSATTTITVNPTPTVNVSLSSSTLCSGQSATAVASGATSFTWAPGNLTGATQVLGPTSTQVYTITGSNGNCSSISNRTLTVVACTGINEIIAGTLQVYAFPNPFKDDLVIETNEPAQLMLTNTLGQVLKTVNINGKTTLQTNDLPRALYILNVKTETSLRIIKLMKD